MSQLHNQERSATFHSRAIVELINRDRTIVDLTADLQEAKAQLLVRQEELSREREAGDMLRSQLEASAESIQSLRGLLVRIENAARAEVVRLTAALEAAEEGDRQSRIAAISAMEIAAALQLSNAAPAERADQNSEALAEAVDAQALRVESARLPALLPRALIVKYAGGSIRELGARSLSPLVRFIFPDRVEELERRRTVQASGLFDADYYVRTNPDVAGSVLSPIVHYVRHGARERRNPSANFNAPAYAELHDLAPSDDPILHKLAAALNALEQNPELFNRQYYLTSNPDVRDRRTDPRLHFLRDGWREGRNPAAGVDARTVCTRIGWQAQGVTTIVLRTAIAPIRRFRADG